MNQLLREVQRIEILSLQDNYINAVSADNNDIIERSNPLKENIFSTLITAEPGLSLALTVEFKDERKTLLYDFGYSEDGALQNAKELNFDLQQIDALALSHGHLDHVGGIKKIVKAIGKENIEFVTHPEVFRNPRYIKPPNNLKLYFPEFKRETVLETGVNLKETRKPYGVLDNTFLFLGEIPRESEFEKGMPLAYYDNNGEETWDDIIDDTAIVVNIEDKGLVVISACAHSGIINTINYAKKLLGIDKVFVVMGGFHLSGADFETVIKPTVKALKEINPEYIIPTHCTGWEAVRHIEKEMSDAFIINMSGTKLTFKA